MKKDIEWLREEINKVNPFIEHTLTWKIKVLDLINQLDEPEVLSQEWIDENSYNVHLLGTPDVETVAVPREKLQNLLVPKQEEITEEQAWEVIHGKYGDEVLQNNIDYVESQGYAVSEKPVIPQSAADLIEHGKERGATLDYTLDKILNWGWGKDSYVEGAMWAGRNLSAFIKAWEIGYEVEQEPKWAVTKEGSYLEDLNLRGATINGSYHATYIPKNEVENIFEVWATKDKQKAEAVAVLIDGEVEEYK